VTDLGLLELQRLDGAAIVGRGHGLDLDAQILLELREDRRPPSRDLGRVLGGQEPERDLLGPARIGGAGGTDDHQNGEHGCERDSAHTHMNPP
jgi:hypothetical protein